MKKRDLLLGTACSSVLALVGCGGSTEEELGSDSLDHQPPSVAGASGTALQQDRKFALAYSNEVEAILNYSHQPTWVYYTDRIGSRWYISHFDLYNGPTGIYSLGPLTNGKASWWTVATNAITGSSVLNTLTIGTVPDDPRSDTFYDIGRKVNVTDSLIHSDRTKIANSSVPAKWYFFSGPNGRWYIIADPGYGSVNPPDIRRFDSLNGNYNWVKVDTTGVQAIFQWFLGQLTIRLNPVPGFAADNLGFAYDRPGSGNGAQCVDLMHHYTDSALGIDLADRFPGNAYPIYRDAAATTVKTSRKYGAVAFTKVPNTPSGIPNPGDIIFWNFGGSDPGHVAIITEADLNSFTSLDQNWLNPSVTNGSPAARIQHTYNNVAGWLQPTW